jgi:Spy/CpxP family protein refolding chaperone
MQKPNIFVLAALSLALAAPLLSLPAQAAHGAHGQREGKRLQKLAGELGLTDAQKAQMKPVLQNARQQAKAIKDDTTLSSADRQAKIKALRKSTRTQTMAILTPDQRATLKSIRQAKRAAKQGTA